MTLDNPQSYSSPVTPHPQQTLVLSSNSDTTLSEALLTLRKRRTVVLLAVALGALFGFYKSLTQVKPYEAFGRIEVNSGSSNEFKLSPFSTLGNDPQQKVMSQISIITSDTLLSTVAAEMNLANNKDFLGVKGLAAHRSMDDPRVRQSVLKTLQRGLKVALVPKTDIIRISFSSLDPRLSANVVNTVIADYIQRSYETRFESTKQVSKWLQGQLDDLKKQVETSQEQVLDLGRKLGTLGFDAAHNQFATQLDDLAKASGTTKLARIVAESRYRMLSGMDPNAIEGSIDSAIGTAAGTTPGGLTGLRSSLAGSRASYAQLTATLGPNHPQVKAAKAEIDELQRSVEAEETRLLTQAKENYLIAKANEDETRASLEQEKQEAYSLRDDQVEYTLRLREFESNRTLYEGLLQKLRTAGVEAGLASSEIDIIDSAVPPAEPLTKPRSTIVLSYLLVGLAIGVILAFLLESLDTGLRSVAEVESVTELPSLAVIPRARRSTQVQLAAMSTVQRNLNVLTQPKSQFTEAFRSLRTALLLSSTGHEPKYLLFTSATPSEGKTTAASNLAVILAQGGTHVLLIDADLRRPNVHHRFGLNGKSGLSTVLSGQTRLEDSTQAVLDVPGLNILASGPIPPFPSEMLSSSVMAELLRQAGELYTHIVIDSPPILSVTDGIILSRQVDVCVLVIRNGKTSKPVVRRARDLLVRSGAPIAGVALNAVDLESPEYYGYYGSSGYSYSSLDNSTWEAKASIRKSRKQEA